MKAVETLKYEGKIFTVMAETFPEEVSGDDKKACISYFINGIEVTDWDKLTKRYQRIFAAMADNICEGLGLIKWCY